MAGTEPKGRFCVDAGGALGNDMPGFHAKSLGKGAKTLNPEALTLNPEGSSGLQLTALRRVHEPIKGYVENQSAFILGRLSCI